VSQLLWFCVVVVVAETNFVVAQRNTSKDVDANVKVVRVSNLPKDVEEEDLVKIFGKVSCFGVFMYVL